MAASALDVAGGMTWRKLTGVLYNGDSSRLRGPIHGANLVGG